MRPFMKPIIPVISLVAIPQLGCLLSFAAKEKIRSIDKKFEGSRLPEMRAEGVAQIKQISPGKGWTMMQGHLFWTRNNGGMWLDITPQAPPLRTITNIFFSTRCMDEWRLWTLQMVRHPLR